MLKETACPIIGYVLEESELSTRTEYPMGLRNCQPDISDRTQHKGGDHMIAAPIGQWECLPLCGDDRQP